MASSKVTSNDLNVNTVITDMADGPNMAAHVRADNTSGDSNQKSNAADTTGENDKTVNSDVHKGTTNTTAIMSNGSNVAIHQPGSLRIHINTSSIDGTTNTNGNTVDNTGANTPSPHDSPRSHSTTTTPANSGHTHEFVVPSSSRTVPTTSPSYGPSPTGIHPNGASSIRTPPGTTYVPPLSSRQNSKASIHRRTPSTPTPVVASSSRSPLQTRSSSTNAYPSRAQIAQQEKGNTPARELAPNPHRTRGQAKQEARREEEAAAEENAVQQADVQQAAAEENAVQQADVQQADVEQAIVQHTDVDETEADEIDPTWTEQQHEEVCEGGWRLLCCFHVVPAIFEPTGEVYEQQQRAGLLYPEVRLRYYARVERIRQAMLSELSTLTGMHQRRQDRLVWDGQRTEEGYLNDESADEAEMVMEEQPRPKQREAPVLMPPKAKRQKATAKPKSKATAKPQGKATAESSSKTTGKGKGKAAVRG
ncbi:unnamed protein product [Zymoseptoria tritici ST99CH_1A5]|uniref:Uncharacterized protein n=1 Tax=Zymoseptoria tritici ST99CH_1A5 TaxID=1276529 RepID=A0A1Y6LZ19_ZYMTR|nr:unnamed protein product [Zymoseptoria tritici ST99CH_1A5]